MDLGLGRIQAGCLREAISSGLGTSASVEPVRENPLWALCRTGTARPGDVAVHLPIRAGEALVTALAPERHGNLAALGHALLRVSEVGAEARRIGLLDRALRGAFGEGAPAHSRAPDP